MNKFRLGPVKSLALFGGGSLLVSLAKSLRGSDIAMTVIAGPRHAEERLHTGDTFASELQAAGIRVEVIAELAPENLGMVTASTLGLSFGAPWIFREAHIKRFEGRLLNVHGARLPADRGAGGFSWQILRQNRLGCCLIHRVTTEIDAGPIVARREFVYPTNCRIPRDYQNVYEEESRAFLTQFLEEVRGGSEYTLMPQEESMSTYWPRLSSAHHGYIDWTWSGPDIERFICAFDEPYAGASTLRNGERVYLKDVFLDIGEAGFHPFQSGLIFRTAADGVFVAARGGALVVRRVHNHDAREITDRMRVGDRLYTPSSLLDSALEFKAVYSSFGLQT